MIQYIVTLFMENPIGQIIGFLAFISSIVAFLHKDDKKFYFYLLFSFSLWTIHFIYLGLIAGAFINFINIFRTIGAIYFKKSFLFAGILFLSYFIVGFFFIDNIINLLPIITGFLGILAFIFFSGLKTRLILLINSFLWFVYHFIGNSLGGILTEVFMIISNLITIKKMKR